MNIAPGGAEGSTCSRLPLVERRAQNVAMSERATTTQATTAELVPFVPRLTLTWLRDDSESTWREVEGTVAFIDISGFTAMSERLSSLGKAGAEEVTEVMNATFAELLAVAYEQGGGLLKFGGDALLLLYEGPDHAGRAARAAFEMRRTLRAIGRPRTSAGAVQLKMHAGLHSGRFQFFLVGDSHRELLIAGPAATRTVEMEATSEAGEILVSAETAAALEPGTLADKKGEGRLLRGAPDVHGSVEPLPNVEDLSLEVAVPAPLRAQLLEIGPLEGEHRHASIAFVRFSGTDEIIATEGSEAAADALDALVRTVQGAADEHGVTFLESDIDRDGGRIILVSGAPQTFGDDEERMLRTVRAIVDSGLPLPVHIGVSEGRVFTGQVGASFRRTYTVLGDTAALAARLMARAGEDEIWVSAGALTRGGSAFEAAELEPLTLKGKAEPVQAFVLGDLLPETAKREPGPVAEKLPFVDRERERAVLAASVAPVRMGFGTLVELVGEPGIGKSRLADELRENCADMRQVTLRCEQYESSTAYYPFRPFLRSLLDVELNGGGEHNRAVLAERLAAVDEELVPWTPLLAAPLDVEVESTREVDDLDPSFWRARLHGVMGNVLGKLLDAPTLIVFEDVHWMDDASSELLRYLGTQLSTHPWLACTTRRGVEGGFAAAEGTPPLPALTLRLEPLPVEDAKTLVQAAAGGRPLTDDELAALMERGAGNPLFLQELASPEGAEDEAARMPDTVEGLVATRIDKLAPGDRALLRWASVLGVSFSGALIHDVLEGDPTAASDSEAWERLAEFVERDPDVPGAFRFRHALIRDGAYEGLSYRRRRELHGRVADVIEQRHEGRTGEVAEILALHFHRADRWPETWRYSVEAGRRAEAKYANVEAAQFFQQALDVTKHVPDVADEEVASVAIALGEVRILLGQYEAAGTAFALAGKHVREDPLRYADLAEKRHKVPIRLGQYSEALRWLSRGMRALENVDGDEASDERARLMAWYASVRQLQRQPRDAIEWAHRAIAETERTESGPQEAEGVAWYILDWAYLTLGRAEEAVYADRALEIFEETGNLKRIGAVLNHLAMRAYLEGRWDDSISLANRGRDATDAIGDSWTKAAVGFNIAEVLADQGRFDQSEPLVRESLRLWQETGATSDAAEAMSLLGRVLTQTGESDEARTLFDEALAVFRETGDEAEELRAHARIADWLFTRGETEAALDLVAETLERTTRTEGMSVLASALLRIRGDALAASGRPDAALQAYEDSLEAARSLDANLLMKSTEYEVGRGYGALARLAEATGDDATSYAAERDRILQPLGVAI
jgi:class 3 adenylate cyclase/tetratricopeptide (TPR) repeat protein